jgi:hypothetical protein
VPSKDRLPRLHLPGLLALVLLGLGSLPPAASAPVAPILARDPLGSGVAATVGTLTCEVPDGRAFTLHGTLPLPKRSFDRRACPYEIRMPDGTPLMTQWELVARLVDVDIVELRARVPAGLGGLQRFMVVEAPSAWGLSGYDASVLALASVPGALGFLLQDQQGTIHALQLAGPAADTRFERLGPATITIRRTFGTSFGDLQTWWTVNAGEQELELVINWHAGGLPARPDVYFTAAALALAPGWSFSSLLPDPASGTFYLVKPDLHVIPQRWQRSFRLVIHPTGTAPDLSCAGFAVGDWSKGGYLASDTALPSLDHAAVDLAPQKATDFAQLSGLLPTQPGVTVGQLVL